MRKILTALLAVTALLALAACDSGNGGGGSGTGNGNDSDLSLELDEIAETLTVPVTSAAGFDFTGTWDSRTVISEHREGYGTEENTQESVVVVTSERVTMTATKWQERYVHETEEAYNQEKGADVPEGFTASFDDGSRTITLTATKEYLDELTAAMKEQQQTYNEFVASLDALIAQGATVTTNSGRTAIKVVTEEERESITQIMVKRQD